MATTQPPAPALSPSTNWIDADLLHAYKIGLVLGVILLTSLSLLFPPDPTKLSQQRDGTAAAAVSSDPSPPAKKDDGKMDETVEEEPIPLINESKWQTESSLWTPHRQLNTVVYVILISVTIFVLEVEYPGGVMASLARLFPKEVSLLSGGNRQAK
jgi:hypothetical protein